MQVAKVTLVLTKILLPVRKSSATQQSDQSSVSDCRMTDLQGFALVLLHGSDALVLCADVSANTGFHHRVCTSWWLQEKRVTSHLTPRKAFVNAISALPASPLILLYGESLQQEPWTAQGTVAALSMFQVNMYQSGESAQSRNKEGPDVHRQVFGKRMPLASSYPTSTVAFFQATLHFPVPGNLQDIV